MLAPARLEDRNWPRGNGGAGTCGAAEMAPLRAATNRSGWKVAGGSVKIVSEIDQRKAQSAMTYLPFFLLFLGIEK